jgi:hypothetical protein
MTKGNYEELCALEDEASKALAAAEEAPEAFGAVAAKYKDMLPPIIPTSGDPTEMLAAALHMSENQCEVDWEGIVVVDLREAIIHEDELREGVGSRVREDP